MLTNETHTKAKKKWRFVLGWVVNTITSTSYDTFIRSLPRERIDYNARTQKTVPNTHVSIAVRIRREMIESVSAKVSAATAPIERRAYS